MWLLQPGRFTFLATGVHQFSNFAAATKFQAALSALAILRQILVFLAPSPTVRPLSCICFRFYAVVVLMDGAIWGNWPTGSGMGMSPRMWVDVHWKLHLELGNLQTVSFKQPISRCQMTQSKHDGLRCTCSPATCAFRS